MQTRASVSRSTDLEHAFKTSNTQFVAFMDESYQLPNSGFSGSPFYLLSACIFPIGSLDDIRSDLRSIVPDGFWHSTEAHRSVTLRPKLQELGEYLAEGSSDEAILLATETAFNPDDGNGEQARSSGLTRLLQAVESHGGCPSFLSIMEERNTAESRAADLRTIASARSAGTLSRRHQLKLVSPSVEPLLWLADVVSFGMNHDRRPNGFGYADPYKHLIQRI